MTCKVSIYYCTPYNMTRIYMSTYMSTYESTYEYIYEYIYENLTRLYMSTYMSTHEYTYEYIYEYIYENHICVFVKAIPRMKKESLSAKYIYCTPYNTTRTYMSTYMSICGLPELFHG